MVTLNDRNTNSVVVLMKNVGTVSRRFHERGVGRNDIGRLRNVFRHGVETQVSVSHAFLQYRLTGKLMRKIAIFGEKFGMSQCGFSELVVPLQLVQACSLALVVDQIKELLLTLGWPSVGGYGNERNKTSNRDNGPVHV